MRRRDLLTTGISTTLLALGVVISTAGVSIAAPPTSDASATLRAHAATALRAGDRAQAVEHLEALARIEHEPAIWQLVGDIELQRGGLDRALNAYENGLESKPTEAALLDRVARTAAGIGDWSRAAEAEGRLVSALARQVEIDPKRPQLDLATGETMPVATVYRRRLSALSELAVLAGDFTTAEEAAHTLISIDERAAEGHLALGYLHLKAGEFTDAADAYVEVLAIDSTHPVALNNLGTIAYMDRDLDTAAKWFEAVLASPDRNAYAESIALANMGELDQLRAHDASAEYLYRQAIDALPRGAWSYMGLAALLDLNGEYDAALDTMIDGWERDGNRLTRLNMHFFEPEWAWQRDALIAEIEGDVDTARALWTQIAKGDVERLYTSARHHLASLDLLDD